MHVRTGDTVLVIAGRERGKTGQITRAFPKENRVIVGGVNLVKRHMKPRPGVAQAGIIEKEAPLHASNVMLICPSCQRPTRVGHRFYEENGVQRKARVCKRCGEMIPTPPVQR
ncbi:MAG TPA: 50S ribosomal protein L24 [Chloroflexota bacterium]|jgi:large subunit ribosomal protein L24|nr:50S ribosomal protein L24 [Chloroflexota bacterium]